MLPTKNCTIHPIKLPLKKEGEIHTHILYGSNCIKYQEQVTIHRDIIQTDGFQGLGEWKWEKRFNEYGISFGDNENILDFCRGSGYTTV